MKKLISIFLLLALMLAVFVACSSGGEDVTSETTELSNDEGDNSDTTNLILPDRDFNGYTFRWLHVDTRDGIVVDEGEEVDASSVVQQANIERDMEIVDRFNIQFEDVKAGGGYVVPYVVKDVLNPVSTYDVGSMDVPEAAAELIISDIVFDAKKVPHLNLDQAWYQQQANEEYSIFGKQYFVAGAFPEFPTTSAFLFNKDMITDLNLDLPYDKIIAGEWTMEELMKYISAGYKDTNSAIPGVDAGDTFSYAGHPYSVAYFYQGMGGNTTTRGASGEVIPVLSNDTVDAIYTKLDEFYFHSNNYTSDTDTVKAHRIFYEGRAMFCYWVTGMIKYQEIDTFNRGLGILPKYDIDQESYCCPTVGGLKLFPANIEDIEPVGYIYEALCEATLRMVYPATIQEARDFEELTDEGSIEVKKIVDQSFIYDVLKYCDPSSGALASCGFILSCFNNDTTPSALAQTVAESYNLMFEEFFAELAEKDK